MMQVFVYSIAEDTVYTCIYMYVCIYTVSSALSSAMLYTFAYVELLTGQIYGYMFKMLLAVQNFDREILMFLMLSS